MEGSYTATSTAYSASGGNGSQVGVPLVINFSVGTEVIIGAPNAVIAATPTNGDFPLNVSFDGSGSTDDSGSIASYNWAFGDGTNGTGIATGHTYTSAGTYSAVLTVTDGAGLSDTASLTITVTNPNAPAEGITSLMLINADSDQDLFLIEDGMQINADLVQNIGLNVRVNTNPTIVGSVYAELSGEISSTRSENVAPYAIFGDNGSGGYYGRQLPIGTYQLTVSVYSGSNLSGAIIETNTINFSIVPNVIALRATIKIIAETYFSLYPNPASKLVQLESNNTDSFDQLNIYDLTGKLVQQIAQSDFITFNANTIQLDVSNLPKGLYLIDVINKKFKITTLKLLIKN